MYAIEVDSDPDRSLRWRERAEPEVNAGQVLIRARATAVNRADLMQRAGRYPPPAGASDVLGLEVAGEIAAIGAGVESWAVGQRVCALLSGGGYAEQVVAEARLLLAIPDSLSFEQAAALPEVLSTAFLNLFLEANLQTGQHALIHAGGSGVGTAAIQICRELGCPVYATASAGKLAKLLELGAAAAIDRHQDDFVERILTLTDQRGVDAILDPVGGEYLQRNLDALAVGGSLVIIATLGGNRAELPIDRLMRKRQRIIGSVLRSRSVAEKAVMIQALEQRIWPLVAAGRIEAIIDRVFPITEADAAHALVAGNSTCGKVVLRID